MFFAFKHFVYRYRLIFLELLLQKYPQSIKIGFKQFVEVLCKLLYDSAGSKTAEVVCRLVVSFEYYGSGSSLNLLCFISLYFQMHFHYISKKKLLYRNND